MKFIECFPISSKIHIFSSSTCIQPQLYIPVLQYFPIKLGIDKHNWIDSIALIDSGSQINAVHSSIIDKLKIATTELLEHKQLCYANNTHETITSYVPQLQFKLYDAHDSKIYYKNNIFNLNYCIFEKKNNKTKPEYKQWNVFSFFFGFFQCS